MFEKVKRFFELGLYTQEQVNQFYDHGKLTQEERDAILQPDPVRIITPMPGLRRAFFGRREGNFHDLDNGTNRMR